MNKASLRHQTTSFTVFFNLHNDLALHSHTTTLFGPAASKATSTLLKAETFHQNYHILQQIQKFHIFVQVFILPISGRKQFQICFLFSIRLHLHFVSISITNLPPVFIKNVFQLSSQIQHCNTKSSDNHPSISFLCQILRISLSCLVKPHQHKFIQETNHTLLLN